MARAMFAAALAQALVPLIALAAGWDSAARILTVDVLGLTIFFGALFVASGWLFQSAASERTVARFALAALRQGF